MKVEIKDGYGAREIGEGDVFYGRAGWRLITRVYAEAAYGNQYESRDAYDGEVLKFLFAMWSRRLRRRLYGKKAG